MVLVGNSKIQSHSAFNIVYSFHSVLKVYIVDLGYGNTFGSEVFRCSNWFFLDDIYIYFYLLIDVHQDYVLIVILG